METVGKSFWEIVPMVDDRPIGPGNPIKEIYFLRPDKVKIYKDPKTFISHYIYHVNNLRIPIPAERVIYFRYHNPVDEYGGLGSVEPAKQSVIADLYCMSWNSSFFENGAVPEGMFLTDRPMPDELFKRFKREIEERWRPGKWRKPLIADNVKWQATTTSPRDMDFLELRKENLEAVLAATGVPKLQIGKSEQINKATAEVEERLFWSKTMLPKLAKFERALNRSLLPAFGENLELTHDTSRIEVLRSNHSELRGSLKNAVGVPFLTVNEARREYADATGRPYEDIEDGDIIYSPGIVLPLGDDLLGEPDIEEEQKTLLIAGKKKQLAARKNGGKPLMLAQPGMNPSSQGFYDEI
jgi:HK97 family phage portal protein